MKIGVIGSGNMGRAIGVRLAHLGHDVMFGARRAEQAESAAALAPGAIAGTNDEAAAASEALIWTIREPDPSRVLASPSVLDGRIVIDINNRDYAVDARTGGWFGQAIAERLQANAPGARIVKAFNTIGMESFDADPAALRKAGAQTFIAGDDPEAKRAVSALACDLGFVAVDLGSGPAAFRASEALGDVIRLLMIEGAHGGRAHLRLDRLPEPTLKTFGERGASQYH